MLITKIRFLRVKCQPSLFSPKAGPIFSGWIWREVLTLSAGSGVHANETVRTGSSGRAGLQFHDQSNLSVGPSSQLRLDKFVYDPNKGTGSTVIEATRGTFRFTTGAQNKGEVKIKTPYGTLGTRG
jgi:hypothetical protein